MCMNANLDKLLEELLEEEDELEEHVALAAGGVGATSTGLGFNTDEFSPPSKHRRLNEQIAITIAPASKVKRTLKVVCDKELNPTSLQTVVDFIKFSNGVLKIETLPVIHLHTIKKPDMTTGAYDRNTNHIHALVGKRLIVDVLRTLAHELTHRRQDETGSLDAQLANADHMDEMGDINTGYENEAYTLAGNLVKIFCRKYPNDKRISKEQLYQLQENKKF